MKNFKFVHFDEKMSFRQDIRSPSCGLIRCAASLFFVLSLCILPVSAIDGGVENEVLEEINVSDVNSVQAVRSDTRTVQQVIINGQPIAVYTVPNPYRVDTAAFNGDVWEGSVSTTVLEYLAGFVPPMKDYIIYRSGQYTYNLYYGTDFSVSGTTVSGTGKRITYDSSAQTYGYADATFSVNTSNAAFVYSNLEGFSDYSSVKEVRYSAISSIGINAAFIFIAVRDIFKSIFR